ncbi:hypothetical protein [Agrococcus jenensis]|uniref:hypothetical protein n=1 Tax=Agrococcus jenensis TaxID=46353 RepID=UPI0011CDBFDB|nr:hypothetical protein [Agrococcus jenensis]
MSDPVPVSDLPFITSLSELSKEDRERFGLYLPSGHRNAYRVERMKGHGGSRTDPSWDRTANQHTCCNSRVYWRHKVACPLLELNGE